MKIGAVILCGGHSTRMGRDKAMLPFGNETLLARIVRLVGSAVTGRIIVVAGADISADRYRATCAELAASVEFVKDDLPDSGPLEGLRRGLAALSHDTEIAFVCSCDMPLLQPRVILQLCSVLNGQPSETVAVVPDVQGQLHPLCAVYRTSTAATAAGLLAKGERRLRAFVEALDVHRIGDDELNLADPELVSLMNCNTPRDYENALRRAGSSGSC
ncbi:MAG: molybdenum cofactor guanylyltransferase [Planctomycetaceae bacterium]|nr:molybdenum cofactor guanylyltransferase [Planctomycetaceae bacterium]